GQGPATCRDRFSVVFSALQRTARPNGQIRHAYLFTVQRSAETGTLQIVSTAVGPVPAELPIETVHGGTPPAGDLFVGGVSFFPWTPLAPPGSAPPAPATPSGRSLAPV